MNNPHRNARTPRLGPAEMIRRILEDSEPVREVARGFGVSERTARKWLAHYGADWPSGLNKRSCCPKIVANRTAEYWIGVIEMLRRVWGMEILLGHKSALHSSEASPAVAQRAASRCG